MGVRRVESWSPSLLQSAPTWQSSFAQPPPTPRVFLVRCFAQRREADGGLGEGTRSTQLGGGLLAEGAEVLRRPKILQFPERENGEWSQPYIHVDGRSTRVQLTGERNKTRGDTVQTTLYQLAPRFRVQREADGTWNVILNIYIRVTDANGKLFEGKEIARRRKAVSKGWWNNHFLARMLGIIQALETSAGHIEVGEGKRAVVVETAPMCWQCPVGLDVMALSGQADLGEELAAFRTRDDEEENDAAVPVTETQAT